MQPLPLAASTQSLLEVAHPEHETRVLASIAPPVIGAVAAIVLLLFAYVLNKGRQQSAASLPTRTPSVVLSDKVGGGDETTVKIFRI